MLYFEGKDSYGYSAGRIEVRNDGTGTGEAGNYEYVIYHNLGTVKARGHIKGFRRKENNGTDLLAEVMRDWKEAESGR